jgi:acyl-CoA synthetase (NDP forming)
LLELVPHTASVENPVDLTFDRRPQDYVQAFPAILLEDDGVDSLFIYLMSPPPRILKNFMAMFDDPEQAKAMAEQFMKSQCESLAALPGKYGKPVVGGTFSSMSDPFMQQLRDEGVVVLPSPERAVTALSGQAKYAKFRRKISAEGG